MRGSDETNELHQRVAAALGRLEQRYTRNRRALVEALADARGPLSIPEILARHTDLPQSSVYRNLSILDAAGVVRRVAGAGEHGRYELAEDLTGHHHHLVCRSCGGVEDVELPVGLERDIDRAAHEIGTTSGFTAEAHSLDFVGVCSTCNG